MQAGVEQATVQDFVPAEQVRHGQFERRGPGFEVGDDGVRVGAGQDDDAARFAEVGFGDCGGDQSGFPSFLAIA